MLNAHQTPLHQTRHQQSEELHVPFTEPILSKAVLFEKPSQTHLRPREWNGETSLHNDQPIPVTTLIHSKLATWREKPFDNKNSIKHSKLFGFLNSLPLSNRQVSKQLRRPQGCGRKLCQRPGCFVWEKLSGGMRTAPPESMIKGTTNKLIERLTLLDQDGLLQDETLDVLSQKNTRPTGCSSRKETFLHHEKAIPRHENRRGPIDFNIINIAGKFLVRDDQLDCFCERGKKCLQP